VPLFPRWRDRLAAGPLYLTLSGVVALLFTMVFSITAIYRIEAAGLNPLQLVLVGTVLELAAFLFEIPTGVVADTYSRRLSIVIGYVLIGLGFLVEGSLPLFLAILLGQVLWGIGSTFTSGAQEAWLADEVGDQRAAPIYLRAAQAGLIGGLIGALLGGGLATLGLQVPIVLGGGLFIVLALVLAVVMPERGFQPTPRGERSSWRVMVDTARAGARQVRGQPLLLTLLGVAVFWGMSSEGFDRLWAALLLETTTLPPLGPFAPVAWFGVISAGSQVFGLVALEIVRRRLNPTDQRSIAWLLFGITALLMAVMLVFALAGSFALALATYWLVTVLRRVHDPVTTAWLNLRLDSGSRATVLSMQGQADAFGQITGGPVLGVIGTLASVRAAIISAAVALVPALWLGAQAIRQQCAPVITATDAPANE
jgi:DHA3 family tetracycline resistance protein-like MFS transporter